MILRETSAFGVRRTLTERRKLQRETKTVSTPHGEVTVKLGLLNGEVVQVAPEYESCRAIAAQADVPLKAVYDAAVAAAALIGFIGFLGARPVCWAFWPRMGQGLLAGPWLLVFIA